VGGRPPGSGQSVGNIPRGVEVLVKKASVDPQFKAVLLERRAAAAQQIGLELEAAEAMMLAAVPREQLEALIARTTVPAEHRRAFLGQATVAMLATLGVVTATGCPLGCKPDRIPPPAGIAPDRPPDTKGIRPDRPPEPKAPKDKADDEETEKRPETTRGIRPDRPKDTPEAGL